MTWRCTTCRKTYPDTTPRHREPGWQPGDYDCTACYRAFCEAHPVDPAKVPPVPGGAA